MPLLPDMHFGEVSSDKLDWRKDALLDKSHDDDAVLDPTPRDVVAMLGLDPLELFGEVGKADDYSDEYYDAMMEKVKSYLPAWLYKDLMKLARASAGGRAKARRRREDMAMEFGFGEETEKRDRGRTLEDGRKYWNWNEGDLEVVEPGEEETEKSFTLTGDISKADDEKQIVFGWASVVEKDGKPVVDLQKDVMDADELEDMAYNYVLESRVGGEMHKQKNDAPVQVGRLVESMVFTRDKQEALGVDLGKVAWWVGMKIDDEEVWKKCKSGEYKGFSIHGRGIRSRMSE